MAVALVLARSPNQRIYPICSSLRHVSVAGTSHAKQPFVRVQTKNYLDVAARARELGCRVPVGVALLPGNFSTAASAGEFCYHAATPRVRSAWQSVGFEDEGPDAAGFGDLGSGVSSGIRPPVPGPQPPVPSETGPQPLAPSTSAKVPLVAFFGAGLLAGSPLRLVVALGMVSSVLASHPRCASPRDVRLDVVVSRPRDRGYACIVYRGDAFGIVPLVRDVRRVWTG